MSLRHLLTLLLALRAKELSDFDPRTLFVLSNRVPRRQRGLTEQGDDWESESPCGLSGEALYLCHTGGFH